MKKIFKLGVTTVGLVLILAAVAAALFLTRMNEIARKTFERQLTYLYMTDVSVDKIVITPWRETVEIQGMTLFNPPAFKKGPALHVDRTLVDVDFRSMLTKNTVIRKALLEGIDVCFRYEAGDGVNLAMLVDNAVQLEEQEADERETYRGMDEPPFVRRPMIIEQFLCGYSSIHLSTNLVPFSSASMRLAPFEIEEFGNGKPVSPARVAVVFMRGLMAQAMTVKGLIQPVADTIGDGIDKLKH